MMILGSTGFIGSRLVEVAPEEFDDVMVNLRWVGTDKATRNDFDQAWNIQEMLDSVASRIPRRFVGIGSQAELAKDTQYGIAKAAARDMTRLYCNQRGIEWVWVRLYSVYGPGDKEDSFIPTMIRNLRSDTPMTIYTANKVWDYLYLDDAVDAIIQYATGDEKGIFDVGYGQSFPIRMFGQILEGYAGKSMFKYVNGNTMDLHHLYCNSDYKPKVSIEEGLRKTWELT